MSIDMEDEEFRLIEYDFFYLLLLAIIYKKDITGRR